MKVAAIQMVSGTDLHHNLQQAQQLLQQAAHAGAELAVLPEYFAFMGQRDTDKLALQEPWGHGPVQDFLARTARELQLWLVGGTLPLASAEPQRASNTSLAYNPVGDCVARYDKIHLFCYDNGREHYDEAQTLLPGRKRPPNALLARGWIQVQAVVGAAGCQRWGSREEMSACLVVGRRVMTSRRYA